MTPEVAFALVCIGLILWCGVLMLMRQESDARRGRRLLEAAGSEELAELAIRQTRDIRALNDALRMREQMRRHRSNVVRFVPRITSGGRPVHFTPDGAA